VKRLFKSEAYRLTGYGIKIIMSKIEMNKCTFFGCVLVFVVFLIFGCGGVKLSGLVPVSGVVIYKDQPLDDATVGFVPKNFKTGDRIGTGKTNAQGKFELRTIGELGVLPNDYCVIIIKNVEDTSGSQLPEPKQKNRSTSRPTEKIKSLIPKRYNDAKNSGLNFVVGKDGLKGVKIELVD
jgi:hypothetical protein